MSTQAAAASRATGVFVRYTTADGAACSVDLVDAAATRFEDLPPHRAVVSYKGQRNFSGLWWFATTGAHVPYESWVERDQVMVLDRSPDVVAVRSQPFAVNVPLSTGSVWHTPDYFVRLRDGRGRVVDVRPDTLIKDHDRDVFEATAQACARIGWGYDVVGELSPVARSNLRWLAAYRHQRNAVAGASWDAVRAVVRRRGQTRVGDLSDLVGVPGVALLPHVYHRLWTGQLEADLSRLLSASIFVQVAESA